MSRKTTVLLLCAAVLLAPGILLAQEEVSLQSLTDRIDILFTNVSNVTARIEALETQVAPPPSTSTPTATSAPVTVTPTATAAATVTPALSATIPRYEVHVIFDEYEDNDVRANAKYLDKVIEVTGVIVDVEKKGGGFFSGPERYEVTLDGQGFLRYLDCEFPLSLEESIFTLTAGEPVTLKGYVSFGNGVKINMEDCEIVESGNQ